MFTFLFTMVKNKDNEFGEMFQNLGIIRSELSIRKSTTMIGRRQLMDHRLVNTVWPLVSLFSR
ncbi:hypothetical protein DERF_009877 [Dermatophagoides farinae]|uniref:Uncharacterized protein n=1 Tax=Dermatophagoides farinae TaxID=6954 RepID=A0A922HUT3_DERFA|nr:hypothetical protein DERF_009877 [Dermatophagoides farinae]